MPAGVFDDRLRDEPQVFVKPPRFEVVRIDGANQLRNSELIERIGKGRVEEAPRQPEVTLCGNMNTDGATQVVVEDNTSD